MVTTEKKRNKSKAILLLILVFTFGFTTTAKAGIIHWVEFSTYGREIKSSLEEALELCHKINFVKTDITTKIDKGKKKVYKELREYEFDFLENEISIGVEKGTDSVKKVYEYIITVNLDDNTYTYMDFFNVKKKVKKNEVDKEVKKLLKIDVSDPKAVWKNFIVKGKLKSGTKAYLDAGFYSNTKYIVKEKFDGWSGNTVYYFDGISPFSITSTLKNKKGVTKTIDYTDFEID